MTLTKVLEMLYGKVASGYLQATYIENGKCRSKCFQIDQLSEMESFIRKYGKSCNTYIDINPRNREMEYYERGSRDDISTVVGAYQDYDIKGIAHKEENLPLSAEELYAFLKELPVQPTFLVYTGNGVHAYWLFEKPYEIHSASERSYIEQILKGWETYVHHLAKERYGWNFDAVADLPRMLRAPETTNFKTEERPICKVVCICENCYLPADLEPYCDTKQISANPVPDADEFALMGTGSAEELISKCTFLQHCRDNAANISEPYWYAMLSNVALTADGHEMAHSLSSPYPGYTYQETEKKYRHALEQDKPTTCEFIKNRLCFHCGRSCGVRAPIALVHSKASIPPNWEEPIPFDNFSVPDFPVETLPEAIGTYVSAVAESTQTPVDLAATSAIAMMSICLQGKYKIQPKGDWQENLNTFCLAFMEPSERKSAVGSAMLRPINTYEQEWNKLHAAEVDFSKTEKSILERRLKTLEDQASKGKAEISEVRKASEELTNFREKRPLQLYVDDVTTEKLVSILAENDGKTAIFSTEGGIFDMLKGIYTKYVNIDVFLKSYSGDPIRVDRIGRASDASFDIDGYLSKRIGKIFARGEDNSFINGTGEKEPTGILHESDGADVGVTVESLTYDEVINLYFSVKAEYRKNGVWLMNDETALVLRKLKDSDGNYLWNHANDTILGKPVMISEFMPGIASGKKPIAFGDFSYYWIISRSPVFFRALFEKFALNNQIGYLSTEYLDAKLVRKDAIKVIQMA